MQRREANTKKAIKVRCRTALLAAVAAFCAAVDAAEFSKAAGELTFTPGSPDVKAKSSATKSDDARLRDVERQQHDFEAGRPQ